MATPSAVSGTARLTINVILTGAVAETGQLIEPVAASCAAFAQSRDNMFLIPSGPANATLAGNRFQLTAPIAQYAGPGDYSLSTNGFAGNQLTTELTLGPVSAPERFKIFESEEAATVNADGPGSFTFLDRPIVTDAAFTEDENDLITWTCRTLSG